MTLTQKRLLILLAVMIIAFVSGRLAVRGFLNFERQAEHDGGNYENQKKERQKNVFRYLYIDVSYFFWNWSYFKDCS